MVPSDPDFPYEMQALECVLSVPTAFPEEKSTLKVTNKEMGRGYQINVEHGFDSIVERMPQATILQHLYALDRDLESLLAAPKAETVKIISNATRNNRNKTSKPHDQPVVATDVVKSQSEAKSLPPSPIVPSYSSEQLEKARQTRKDHIRQFEARMGRLPLFAKAPDGISYDVPIQPRRNELPASLRGVNRIKLIVPERYNLDPCRIEIPGVSGDEAGCVKQNFKTLVAANPDMNLFSLVNKLSQTMHQMSKQPTISKPPEKATPQSNSTPGSSMEHSVPQSLPLRRKEMHDKSHVVFIPRPPEWGMLDKEVEGSEEGSSWDEDSDDADDTGSGEDELVGDAEEPHRPERGILISFPNLELYGVELMELITISITVKCDRCKDVMDVPSLRDSSSDNAAVKTVTCKKCSNQLSIGK